MRHVLVATAVGLGLAAASPDAAAFCRITTIETVADGDDTTGCYDTTHAPVWWRSACLGLSVAAQASKYAPYAVVDDILFHTVVPNWVNADCPGGGRPSVDVFDLGPVACDEHQDNLYGPNANVVLFHDDAWPYEGDVGCKPGDCCDATIALTTVTFHPDTGELWDADIEINSACHPISTTLPVPADRFDLQSVLQHEVGHFFGLAHPPVPAAVMYYLYSPGSDGKRVLNRDDIAGLCTIYPPDGARGVAASVEDGGAILEGPCNPTPRNGFASACVSEAGDAPPEAPRTTLSCDVTSGPVPCGALERGALLALAMGLAGRRRARARAQATCYRRPR